MHTCQNYIEELAKTISGTLVSIRKLLCVLCFPAENTTCHSVDEFECGNGDCINYSLTCDGRAHCKDKSDEKPSYCCKCWVFLSLACILIGLSFPTNNC